MKKEKKEQIENESMIPIDLPNTWFAFVFVRIVWTLVGQRGYLHPDEYFQSLEVVTSDLFDKNAFRTWEFQLTNSSKPIRNIAVPYLTYGISIELLKFLTKIGIFSVTTNNLILFPRLIQVLLSLLGDFYVYKISKLLNINANKCLVLFSSSYVTLIYLTHTFSNSIETVLFAAFLFYTIKSLKCLENNENTDFHLQIIGLIACVGVFNRPTFVIYCFVPICYLAYRYKSLAKLIVLLSSYSLITALSFIIVDTFYYASSLDLNNLIITPLNFLLYNMNQDNLSSHGAHPVYQHVLVNCFLLFGLQYLRFCRNFKKNLLCLTFTFVVTIFSLVAHKEARFLIPLVIIICLVTCNSETELFTWYSFNFILALIYGIYHQGALIDSLDFVKNMFKHEANVAIGQQVFYYQTYMPPRYLLNVQIGEKASDQNAVHDMMSSIIFKDLEIVLEESYRNMSKLDERKNLAFFLITPSINDKYACASKQVKFHIFYQFHFHIQFEKLSNYLDLLLCNYETCNHKCKEMNFIERFLSTFTLNLYQFVV